jgi:hypothetical protein
MLAIGPLEDDVRTVSRAWRTASGSKPRAAAIWGRGPMGRTPSNHMAILAAVETLLEQYHVRQVFLGSLSEMEFPLTEHILRNVRRRNRAIAYWIPSRSQIQNRPKMRQLLTLCDWIQMNQSEMEELTGISGLVAGVNSLRDEGFCGSLVVTAGSNGMLAFHRGNWLFQRAFQIHARKTNGAGDCTAGTLLAWLHDRPHYGVAEGLRYAAAAAAMRLAGMPRGGGWEELAQFARYTPLRTLQKRALAPRQEGMRPTFSRTGGNIAAGLLGFAAGVGSAWLRV